MEDITIVLADKQPLTATQVMQAHERILAEGAAAERARIRQMALDEAKRNRVPGSEGSGDCREAFLHFADLLEKP